MSKDLLLTTGKRNLRYLIEEIGGQKEFEELTEISNSAIFNWLSKEPPQQITFKMATKIEQAFDKPHGWLHDGLLIDPEGNPIKPVAKSRNRRSKPAVEESVVYKSRHDTLDTIVASYIEDTGKKPSETGLLDLMTWSYGKTLE